MAGIRALFRVRGCSLHLLQQQHFMSTAAAAIQNTHPFRYVVLRAGLMTEEEGNHEAVPAHLRSLAERLDATGGLRASPGTAGALEAVRKAAAAGQPLALLHATGGTEAAALELALAHRTAHAAAAQRAGDGALPPGPPPPLLLLAHPLANSLPSALETMARMQRDGHRGRICYLPSAATAADRAGNDGWGALRLALLSVRVWHALARSRIGLVGPPSDWLVASVPSGEAVRAAWGPTLADVGMDELMSRLLERTSSSGGGGGSGQAELEAAAADLRRSGTPAAAAGCCAPGPGEAAPAAAVYLALRDLVAAHGLSAVTVRCFDIVGELRTSGCYALARLLDERVVAGCEGDVCAALGMLFGSLMTGQVCWMANVAQVDVADGMVTLAHCTAARSLLSECQTTTHMESGLGVSFKGSFEPGPVTLLHIGGRDAERLWAEEGYLHRQRADGPGAFSAHLCRTQARVRLLGGRDSVELLLRRPLGNHVVMLRGHWKAALQDYHSTFGPGAVLVQ